MLINLTRRIAGVTVIEVTNAARPGSIRLGSTMLGASRSGYEFARNGVRYRVSELSGDIIKIYEGFFAKHGL